ncbi:MAG: WD40 repeat domain-containing protein [Planctomycetota bacterium]|nr:WD40 repeat domain-containing protein [Planctomycetota bacterium]
MNWPRLGMLLSTFFACWCRLVGDDCRADDANRAVPVAHDALQRKSAPSVTGVAFSPDGSWLAVARGAEVALLDVATGATKVVLKGATQNLNAVAVNPDGSRVAAAGGESGISGEVLVWTLPNPEPKRFVGHTDSIYSVAYNADGSRLVTASYDKLLLLWNSGTGEVVSTLRHHTAPVYSAQFSPDGKSILSGGADQTVKLWSAETGERLLTLSEATKGINAVVFHPKGLEFAAAGIDRTIRVYEWNGTTARLKRAAFAHDAPVLALAYSPDGATLFSGSEDRRVKAWEVATLRERHVYEELPDWPLTLAVDPAGTRLACGLFNGALPLFETASTKLVRDLVSVLNAKPVAKPLVIAKAAVLEQSPPTPPAAEPAPPKPNPPVPRLDSISPRTVVRGQKVKLTLSGQNIADADRLFVSHGRLTATLLPGDPKNANQVSCEIDLPADFEPELVTLRLHTPLGSTAARSFYVGPFAEVGEKEPNNSREVATPVTLPATLTGAIAVRGDIDVWSFDASDGQELVFHLTGPNLGSSLQARMTVRDMNGQRLASQVRRTGRSEVTLGFRVPQTGKYSLEIQDRDNAGGGNHFYHLHAGLFPFVTGVFPLAIRGADQGERGANEVTSLMVDGFNLDGVAPISPAPGAGGRSPIVQAKLGSSLNAVRYEQSRFAEVTETEPNDDPRLAQVVTIPSGISGRMHTLDQIGTDVDHFAFTARQGERLTIEVIARRIGSPMDSVIEILDAEGRVLPRQTLRSVSETYTELRDHDSRSKGIRLHNWEDFLPGDLILLGGELAKIQILPLGPDEDMKFFDRGGVRLGYLGTTPEAHALNRFAYKVEVHPAGRQFPPNGMPVVDLPWRNDDGGPGFQSDSVLWFDPPADGKYIIRLRDVRGRGGLDATYRLVIRERQEV